jgi:hypothetical protein
VTKARASIFEDTLDLDLKGFAPKARKDSKAPTQEQVRVVAEAANFRSRETPAAAPKTQEARTGRVYRTGRNVQLNIKATRETIDALYAITEAHPGWVLGYTLERALAALQRELEAEPSS